MPRKTMGNIAHSEIYYLEMFQFLYHDIYFTSYCDLFINLADKLLKLLF